MAISWQVQPCVCPVPAYLHAPIAANHLTPALCAISVISWLLTLYHAWHARQSTHSVKPVQICLPALLAIAGSICKIHPLAFPALQLMRNAVAVVKQRLFALVVLALLEQIFRVYYPTATAQAVTTAICLFRQTASHAAINVVRVAIVVPVTRAQSLVQIHQPVHAAMANKTMERALCVEVRLKINFININYIIITACSYACESCTANTVSSCTACYGSSGQNSSRILTACTCPLLGFWDNYPYQSECQACANTRCLSCTNSTQICTACVGTVSNSFAGSRTLPNCGCPNGYYDNSAYSDCQTCAA